MKFLNNANPILKGTSKGMLLLLSRFAIPAACAVIVALIVLNVAALMRPDLGQPPLPVVILILVALPGVLLCLLLIGRAVRDELRNRQDEPSHLGKLLGRLFIFSAIGTVLWATLFLSAWYVLSTFTDLSDDFILDVSVILATLLVFLCGYLLARKDITALAEADRARKRSREWHNE